MLKPIQFDSAALAAAMSAATVEVITPVLNAKQEKAIATQKRIDAMMSARDARERSAAEHNAENRRYDNEGVYYIGGKEVITRYGY